MVPRLRIHGTWGLRHPWIIEQGRNDKVYADKVSRTPFVFFVFFFYRKYPQVIVKIEFGRPVSRARAPHPSIHAHLHDPRAAAVEVLTDAWMVKGGETGVLVAPRRDATGRHCGGHAAA